MRRIVWLALGAALSAASLEAQAVPEGSQAARLNLAFRRSPYVGVDPFRHVFSPRWGLVFQTSGAGWNSALDAEDVGALIFLTDDTKNPGGLLIGDILDAMGLVPPGSGIKGAGSGEGGAYLGGPFGGRVSIGVSAQTRAHGAFQIDDEAVRLFRDGTTGGTEFLVGQTDGSGLVTAEGGVHALINLGQFGDDGPRLTLGFGGRLLRPLYYARAEMATDSRASITDTLIAANVDVESWATADPIDGVDDIFDFSRGSGVAGDFLVRLAWPTSGFALEALVANLGSVTVERLERQTLNFDINTISINEVTSTLDTTEFVVQDTVELDVTLPRVIRFSGSGWANRILQLDVAATMPVTGEFEQAMFVELGSTWRLVNSLPLRAGLLLGGRQGIGYTGGFAIESRNFLFRVNGGSLGGLLRRAKGVSGRFELGFFF